MPKICNYYVTLRCNDTCEFCPIWQNEGFKNIEEKTCDLEPLKKAGITKLNVTGGEPLLRKDLPEILKQARDLGFEVELTTNGIIYPEVSNDIKGLINRLFFSLDYPSAEEHDRSRGVECFSQVIRGIHRALELGESPIIKYTMTRDSVRFLPEMVELAEKLKVLLCLNPVYDFSGTQGYERGTFSHIRYYSKKKNVLMSHAALEFVKNGGNRVVLPRCRAKETTVTLMPDGSFVSPCLFNPEGAQGREDICSSCLRWPYMLPSFSRGLDRYFWLNILSGLSEKHKSAGGIKK